MPTLAACVALALPFVAEPGVSQTTTTNCVAGASTLNCTSTTYPSVGQSMQQLGQSLGELATAIAQRRAAEAQRRAGWAAAATENAKHAAKIAAANDSATTAALTRFAADTTAPTGPRLNADLILDWSLLDGVETRTEWHGQNDLHGDILIRSAFSDTPDGGKMLRIDGTMPLMLKKQHIADVVSSMRLDPRAGSMLFTEEGTPLFATVPPAYESIVRIGIHAFATHMTGRGFDVIVPPGALDVNLLRAAIAAMPGPLPNAFRLWVVDGTGDVVPADVQITASAVVEEPVGPANGSCATGDGRKEKRDAVSLTIRHGTTTETVNVLAAAPHLTVTPELRCRIVRRTPT